MAAIFALLNAKASLIYLSGITVPSINIRIIGLVESYSPDSIGHFGVDSLVIYAFHLPTKFLWHFNENIIVLLHKKGIYGEL